MHGGEGRTEYGPAFADTIDNFLSFLHPEHETFVSYRNAAELYALVKKTNFRFPGEGGRAEREMPGSGNGGLMNEVPGPKGDGPSEKLLVTGIEVKKVRTRHRKKKKSSGNNGLGQVTEGLAVMDLQKNGFNEILGLEKPENKKNAGCEAGVGKAVDESVDLPKAEKASTGVGTVEMGADELKPKKRGRNRRHGRPKKKKQNLDGPTGTAGIQVVSSPHLGLENRGY